MLRADGDAQPALIWHWRGRKEGKKAWGGRSGIRKSAVRRQRQARDKLQMRDAGGGDIDATRRVSTVAKGPGRKKKENVGEAGGQPDRQNWGNEVGTKESLSKTLHFRR